MEEQLPNHYKLKKLLCYLCLVISLIACGLLVFYTCAFLTDFLKGNETYKLGMVLIFYLFLLVVGIGLLFNITGLIMSRRLKQVMHLWVFILFCAVLILLVLFTGLYLYLLFLA